MIEDYEFEEDKRYFDAQKKIIKLLEASKRGLTITQLKSKIDCPFFADALGSLEGQSLISNHGSVLRPLFKVNEKAHTGPVKVCFFCGNLRPEKDFKTKRKIEKVCASCRKFKTKPVKSKKGK